MTEIHQTLLFLGGGEGVFAQSGSSGTLALDLNVQAELTTAFSEPSTSAMVTVSSFPYKVPNDFFQALFKAPRLEEMTKAVGSTCPFSVNPNLQMAVETFCESSPSFMVTNCHKSLRKNRTRREKILPNEIYPQAGKG